MAFDFGRTLAGLLRGPEFPTITPAAQARLAIYLAELEKWQRKINLIGRASPTEICERHFVDSLALLPHLAPQDSLLDIGSGAGFPGLVLACARPEATITLVEPRAKRTAFLRHIIRTLELSQVTVRTDFLAPDRLPAAFHHRFQVVTSRALSQLTDFLPLARACCAPDGRIIAMKGRNVEQELAAWHARDDDSLSLERLIRYTLPASGAQRALAIFRQQG